VERSLFGYLNADKARSGHGYSVGAVYNRKMQIHGRFGGQGQYGISTPRNHPYIFLFTSRQGLQHGYHDHFGDDGTFTYYGEGRAGDMQMQRGNKAIRDHAKNGKHLLVFLDLGEGTYRYLGEFVYSGHYVDPESRDTGGNVRNAIAFRLIPLDDEPQQEEFVPLLPLDSLVGVTQRDAIVAVRTKQTLFRRRVSTVEKECRLTGVMDLRFLRASHIKPWAQSNDTERVDENNGLLLTPSADQLFDHGWVSFRDDGRLIVSEGLPERVKERLGLDLQAGRPCGNFNAEQATFLAHHRDCIFGQKGLQDRLVATLFD